MKEDLAGAELEEEVDRLGVGLRVLADVGLQDVGTQGGHGGDGDFAAAVLCVCWVRRREGRDGGNEKGWAGGIRKICVWRRSMMATTPPFCEVDEVTGKVRNGGRVGGTGGEEASGHEGGQGKASRGRAEPSRTSTMQTIKSSCSSTAAA